MSPSPPHSRPDETAAGPPAGRPGGAPRRRLGLVAVAGIGVLALAYTVFWLVAAANLREGMEEWARARRAEGWSVGHRGLALDGFPLHLRARVVEPHLAPPGTPPPWAWSAGRAVARVVPWRPGAIRLDLGGSHRLVVARGAGGGTWSGDAATLRAEVEVVDGRARLGRVRIAGMALASGDDIVSVLRGTATIRRLATGAADHATPTLALAVDAEGLRLPGRLVLPLGDIVARLVLDGTVLGSIDGPPGRDALAGWRDAGGTVEVGRLKVAHGPLDVSASGTMALDGDMQPIGALTARIGGFFETIDALRAKGMLGAREAVTAKLVLGVLSKRPAGGGARILTVPLSLQHRTLYAGPVALGRVPRLAWPESGQTN